MRVVSLKMNSDVYPLKNTNSHYLLLNTTVMPLCNGKISVILLWGYCYLFAHEVIKLCAEGGFRLTKFVSNKVEVLQSIPEADRSDGLGT